MTHLKKKTTVRWVFSHSQPNPGIVEFKFLPLHRQTGTGHSENKKKELLQACVLVTASAVT